MIQTPLLLTIGVLAVVGFSGCSSTQPVDLPSTALHAGSPRVYNVDSGDFVEAPPFGARGNAERN